MRAIKKIVALATGTLMVGATILGAMAADLSDYPRPLFIKNGKFDGAIVVGDKAAAEDVVGAIDIATSLQYSSTTSATGAGAGTTVTAEGEAYKIERLTDKLNLGEDIADVATKLDAGDLPMVLSDGVYRNDEGKDYDYEQTIELDSELFEAFADNDFNDDLPVVGLHYDDGQPVLTYELSFTSDAESDIDDEKLVDFEDTSITIMGKTYEIVEATNQSGGYFELMGGAIKDTLEEGETKTYMLNAKEYEVNALIVSDTAETVKLKVNGEVTDALSEDDTYKLADGTEIGIRSLMPNEAGEVTGGDIVEFYLGAQKLVLEDNQEIELGDEDIDDIMVYVTSDQDGNEYTLQAIELVWTTEDELFVADGGEAVMPGLETVKLTYKGMVVPTEEEIRIANDGDNTIAITAPIKGDLGGYELAVGYDNETGNGFEWIGDEDYELVLTSTTVATIDYDKNVNNYILISNSDSYETHLLKATGFDTDDGVDFKDEVTGSTYEKKYINESFEVADITFEVSAFNKTAGTVSLDVDDGDFDGDSWYTPEGLRINLDVTTTLPSDTLNITFDQEVDDTAVNATDFWVSVKSDVLAGTNAQVVKMGGVGVDRVGETEDSDEFLYYIEAGEVNTKAILDEGPDEPTLTIFYPGGETYGNVFVAETGTTFGMAAMTVAGGVSVERIEVGTAKLASEIRDVAAQNLIVVGGPCANDVAAEVMGVAATIPECLAGFEAGKAMIKLYNTGAGKVAMLVAGATAEDTRRASRVVANYGDYALSGDEVEVTGVGLTSIQVTKVS